MIIKKELINGGYEIKFETEAKKKQCDLRKRIYACGTANLQRHKGCVLL